MKPPVASIHPLDRSFFARPPRRVARELLGKVLVRMGDVRMGDVRMGDVRMGDARTGRNGRPRLTGRIVEVEAYLGERDPASHAYPGLTPRNAVMFGPAGFAYVYFIYGNHYCLNVSCEKEGLAGAVLFRALEPLTGIEDMARARGVTIDHPRDPTKRELVKLTSGPGRLAEAFGVTRERDNGCDLTSPASRLWIGADGFRARSIRVTPRIGITKAADKPLRYILAGNPFVSGRKTL